jgi:hypothetical protein
MIWMPSPDLPLLNVKDTRSERWKAAEARLAKTWIGRGTAEPDSADIAIVAEEQAAFDAENQ